MEGKAGSWKCSGITELLKSTIVSSIPHKEIITVSSNDTPAQGFEKLLKNNIHSAPVFDEATKKYVGFLDIRDLISYTVFAFHNRNMILYSSPSVNHLFPTLLENVTTTYLARRNPFHALTKDATLMDAAVLLAKGSHRVPIVDSQGNLFTIISQSNLIKLFASHLSTSLKEETAVKIKDIEIGTSPVLSVSKDTPAIEAFEKLDAHKRSGLAILDTHGLLLGHISGRDLKLFVESSFSYDLLELSVLQFLAKLRVESQIDITAVSISCNLEDTLSLVIQKLAATKVHRIFIVHSSSNYSPVRLISLTDVLRCVLLLEVHGFK